jgi:small-conductance mechanosensitive channel
VGTLGHYLKYPYAEIGTPAAILLAFAVYGLGKWWIYARNPDRRERFRKRSALATIVLVAAVVCIAILWARTLQHTGTFLGLVGGGLAIALKEPLLAIAGRIAILAGHAYSTGDRIEVDKITGDVIDIGFFYTRMMEIGNWIAGDQATGRIVQFSNSRIFGDTAVFNYTRNFSYIWDEIKLPVTYPSNLEAAKEILLEAGDRYTSEFLRGAEREMEEIHRYFYVPELELKPQVYLKVTDNWVELTLRYLVDPKRRRTASTFIFDAVFEQLQGRRDITIASTTSDVAIHWKQEGAGDEEKQPPAPGGSEKAA